MDTAATATDSPNTVAVPESSIPDLGPTDLLLKVHARLSTLESNFSALEHRIVGFLQGHAASALSEIRALLAGFVAAKPPAAPVLVSGVALAADPADSANPCCGHAALHVAGGCTAPDCNCTTPPPGVRSNRPPAR